MIKLLSKRDKGRGENYVNESERSSVDALKIMLECEVAFGADILEVTPTRVVTEADVLGCIDVVEFEGTEEEMKPLVQAALFATQLRSYMLSEEHRGPLVAKLMKFTQGNPGMLTMASGMVMGDGLTHGVVLAMLVTLSNHEDMEQCVKGLRQIKRSDLLAMLYLMVGEKVDFETAFSLAA